jgi:PAS domain S-box-containing protein
MPPVERWGFLKLPPKWWGRFLTSLIILVSLEGTFSPPATAGEASSAKNVLVLGGFPERKAFKELEPLKSSIRAHVSSPVNFFVEYLDLERFEDSGYRKSLSENLRQAYKSTKLDLVLVQAYPALRFALDYRDQMFPGVPIVFLGVAAARLRGQKIWPGVTGMTSEADIQGSLDLALRLEPDTQNVALISGASEFERYWDGLFREEMLVHRGNLNLIELAGLQQDQLLRRMSAMPVHTIVFIQLVSRDADDTVLTVNDLLGTISHRFPTYSIFSNGLDHGAVGGSFPDDAAEGKKEGEIAARVLSGEKPENIPVEEGTEVRAVVDWRELNRWNISERLLPPETVVLNRPPSMWELYKWRMIGFGVLLLTQTVLILGLLIHRRRRKRAEESLKRQLAFETLISEISADFVNLPAEQIESRIQKSLVRLQDFLGVDRVSIFELASKESRFWLRHSTRIEGAVAAPKVLSKADYPWLFAQLVGSEPVILSRPDALPDDAEGERELVREFSPGVIVIFPLTVQTRLVGILKIVVTQNDSNWPLALLPQLKVVSQVTANAFARELDQKALYESEARFRVMGDAAPAFIWMSDQEGHFTYLNKKTLEFTGANSRELNGDGWATYVHPDDLPLALEANRQAAQRHERFIREYRVRRHDGVYRWMCDIANPRFDAEGSFVGFIGSAVDVTDQRLAREALEKVGGQLIAAQEKERSYLARELHDDICQRLAMMSLRIEKVTQGWGSGQMPVSEQLKQIWRQCSELTGDVQALSHELHPSILDNLGLVTAVKSFCREFSKQTGAVVDFSHTGIPDSLPREVSLSLFRVAQEALHNAAKYSGVKHFEVHLQGKPGGIELEVSDDGVGFDAAGVRSSEGLGLVSMRERILLLNGTISIESQPGVGTRIRVQVSLPTQSNSVSAHAG